MNPLAVGTAVSAVVTVVVLRLIERHVSVLGLLDVPNARSSHSQPTARGGGLAIVLGSCAGASVALRGMGSDVPAQALACLAAAAIVAAVSFLDDLRSLRPAVRLVAQSSAALVVLGWVVPVRVVELPLGGDVTIGVVGPLCMFTWIVAVTNIFNFMDGIDGIAGGQAIVAGLAWGLTAAVIGSPILLAAGFAIAAASTMFLLRNWAPARIFMGDVGSAFLGFVFSVLPFLAPSGSLGGRAWALAALMLWPFLVDTTITLVRRMTRGENVMRAHREHLYQRLVAQGISHARVALLYAGMAATTALAGVCWALDWLPGPLAAAPAALIAVALPLEVQRRALPRAPR